MGPAYSLDAVHRAAEADNFRWGGSRARDHLLQYFDTFQEAREFVRHVAMQLTEDDFIQTVTGMENGPFDEYGVELHEEVAKRFGIEHARTWYIKLKFVKTGTEELFFLSFHRPEGRMWTQKGPIDP